METLPTHAHSRPACYLPAQQRGSQGRAELLGRAAAFQRGDWIQLLQSARRVSRPAHDTPTLPPDEVAERKRHQACAKVRQGELSRARQVLTACDLAPGAEATWAALTDPARRLPEARTAIDPDILQHQPSQPVHLTTRAVAAALRSARRGGDKPDAQRGVVVLGSPLGHPAFVQAWAEERLRAEQELLDQLPKLPDLQSAWLLLLLCASPRANHAIRTMPPSAAYARGPDDAIWTTLQNMLGGTGDADAAPAQHVAALPGALGGLAETAAPAAYWASWADALPAIHARLPRCAVNYVQLLESEAGEGVHCLAEAAHARRICCRTKAGATAPHDHGACSSTAVAPHHQWRQVPETGRMVGSTTHRGRLPYILAIVCSSLPCRPARAPFSAPEPGSPPYRATRQAASRHRRCKSL